MDWGGRDQYVPDMFIGLEDEMFNQRARNCDKGAKYDMRPMKLSDPPEKIIPYKQYPPTPNYERQYEEPMIRRDYCREKGERPKIEHFTPAIKFGNNDVTPVVLLFILIFVIYLVLAMNAKINDIMYLLRELNLRKMNS